MLKNATLPEASGWIRPALAIVGAITLLRVALLAVTPLDLFVDEAQYWLWGQDLAFGYYSKPPLIGWVIRAVTELAGSDATFWVRLPGPLLHAGTALVLGRIAVGLFGARAGVVTAAGYITLPMVALASIFISTDTVMFLPLALALAGYMTLLQRPGAGLALGMGLCLGLAFLAKYAAVYYLICAGLAALIVPGARPRARDMGFVVLAFVVTISPNLIWNAVNGFTTLEHTLDNADWVRDPATRAGLNLSGLAEFLASQFAVFGPVLFGALLWATARLRRLSAPRQVLVVFAIPIVAFVCVQAVLSNAYANWAAAAYLAGSVLVLPWLSRRWLWASFAVNGALSLALPLIAALAHLPALEAATARYSGRAEMSRAILDTAATQGATAIVAQNRDILADLFYTGRDAGVPIYALHLSGRAPHHYALNFPYTGETDGLVLFVSRNGPPPACDGARQVGELTPTSGAHRNRTQVFYLVPADCWGPLGAAN